MTLAERAASAKAEETRPVWADCPVFKFVWCHAPWTCPQPCPGLIAAVAQSKGL